MTVRGLRTGGGRAGDSAAAAWTSRKSGGRGRTGPPPGEHRRARPAERAALRECDHESGEPHEGEHGAERSRRARAGSSLRGDRRRLIMAQTRPNAPVGTLNQKTARHPRAAASRPPSSGPTTCAADTIGDVEAEPRSRADRRRERVGEQRRRVVMIDAAPTACTPRITSSVHGAGREAAGQARHGEHGRGRRDRAGGGRRCRRAGRTRGSGSC